MMKVKLLVDCDTTNGPRKVGDIIEHPDAHWLLMTGHAEPGCPESQEFFDKYRAEQEAAIQARANAIADRTKGIQ